jgi:hypothetical protein
MNDEKRIGMWRFHLASTFGGTSRDGGGVFFTKSSTAIFPGLLNSMTGREAAKSAEKGKSYVSHYYARLFGRQKYRIRRHAFRPVRWKLLAILRAPA